MMTAIAPKVIDRTISREDILQISEYANIEINRIINPAYVIHNWDYTEDLIQNAELIIQEEGTLEEVANIARAILLFYNIGYVVKPTAPITTSAKMAREFLQKNNFDETCIKEIEAGIIDINTTKALSSESMAIARDALNAYQGQKKILKHLEKSFEEYNITHEETINEVTWVSNEIEKMTHHRFVTESAQNNWGKRKEKNLNKLRRYLFELKKKSSLPSNKRAMTMFKTASRNQVDLANIADKKAGIMITVNAVLLTILLSLFASFTADISHFLIPALILVLTCGISIILATLATKPVSKPEPSRSDFLTGNKSLFFFQYFTKLGREEYKSAVQEVIIRDASFENTIITDLYDVGVILSIKYKKLTWCYWVFAIGIGLTIISFLVTALAVYGVST